MGSYVTMQREALIESVPGTGSPQRVDTAQDTARAAAGRSGTEGCAEPAARCPLAITEKYTALHYWLFYTSRKREGGSTIL